jgi:hypothetical protein
MLLALTPVAGVNEGTEEIGGQFQIAMAREITVF